jgi:hypothetical protein
LGSFKLRLVTYFLLLALLPLLAASWAFSEVAARSEVGNADSRLNAALRVAISDYSRRVDGLELTAKSLANATTVQEAFQTRNRAEFIRQAKLVPRSAFYANGQLLAGEPPMGVHVERSSFVTSEGAVIGKILVWFPLDRTLLAQLRTAAGLTKTDRALLARSGTVIAGSSEIVGSNIAPLPKPSYLSLGDER